MSAIKDNILVCRQFFSNILDSIIKWLPRNKRKWVFGAFGGFRDNPKYLFIHTIEQHPEIRPIWISQKKKDVLLVREQGGEAYYSYSIKGLYHILTSRVAVCDHSLGDINRHLTGGIYYVNLWHGASVKRVRWQAPDDFVRRFNLKNKEEMRTSFRFRMLMYQALFRVPDLCLVPSAIQAKDFFAPMMDIPYKNSAMPPKRPMMLVKSICDFLPETFLCSDNYIRRLSNLLSNHCKEYVKSKQAPAFYPEPANNNFLCDPCI